jgi:type II secretory pathway pseudopilin PulG
MKRAGIILGIILIGVAYVLGFWPQYQKARASQRQVAEMSAELASSQAQVGLYRLQNSLIAVVRQTGQKNYGEASTLSTKFFDDARSEVQRQSDPKVKAGLESILQQRDAVTAALAKGDPSALGLLAPLETTMFQIVYETAGSAMMP